MKPTSTYYKTQDAYLQGMELISNKGSSRSGKTFAACQLLARICIESKKQRKITIVSHTYDHLERGVVYDMDTVLRGEGYQLEGPGGVKRANPYRYNLGNSMIECIALDKPDKALGGARDILFVNEANKIPYATFDHLDTRTTECTFLDYNPSSVFWLNEENLLDSDKAVEIKSTYLNNYENLTDKQRAKFKAAEQRANEEEAQGKRGYHWHWWQCYGLGNLAVMVDRVVFPKVKRASEIPKDANFLSNGVDFSNALNINSDPHCMVGLHYYNKSVYLDAKYQGHCPVVKLVDGVRVEDELEYSDLVSIAKHKCNDYNNMDEKLFVCDRAKASDIYLMQDCGINAIPYEGKYLVQDGIDFFNKFENIYIIDEFGWMWKEWSGYLWAEDSKGDIIRPLVPMKNQDDHSIAAGRYAANPYWQSSF